jgi:hypothetical protein
LRLFNPVAAVFDLRRALALRVDAGEHAVRIGESEVHLGRVYAVCRARRRAERLLEDGVTKLESEPSSPFLIQGLRHLAAFYVSVGRTDDALAKLDRAATLAQAIEAQGQLQQVLAERRRISR